MRTRDGLWEVCIVLYCIVLYCTDAAVVDDI